METTIAIVFILQKKSKERALIYHLHGTSQQIKMLNEWKNTRGLKRKSAEGDPESTQHRSCQDAEEAPGRNGRDAPLVR